MFNFWGTIVVDTLGIALAFLVSCPPLLRRQFRHPSLSPGSLPPRRRINGSSNRWGTPYGLFLQHLAYCCFLGGVMNVPAIAVPFAEHAIFASVSCVVGEGPHNGWFYVFATGCIIAASTVLGSGMAVGLYSRDSIRRKRSDTLDGQ